MEIQIDQSVIDTVCNSLRASRQTLRNQKANAIAGGLKEDIINSQLADVERALEIFQHLES